MIALWSRKRQKRTHLHTTSVRGVLSASRYFAAFASNLNGMDHCFSWGQKEGGGVTASRQTGRMLHQHNCAHQQRTRSSHCKERRGEQRGESAAKRECQSCICLNVIHSNLRERKKGGGKLHEGSAPDAASLFLPFSLHQRKGGREDDRCAAYESSSSSSGGGREDDPLRNMRHTHVPD